MSKFPPDHALLRVSLPVVLCLFVLGLGQEADVSVARVRLPREELPSIDAAGVWFGQKGSRYQPVLVPLGGDRTLLAFLEYESGEGDRLIAAQLSPEGLKAPDFETVTPQPGQIITACGTPGRDGHPVLFWSELVDGTGKIVMSHRAQEGWSAPQEVWSGVAATPTLDCTTDGDGQPWLVWQEFASRGEGRDAGNYELFLAPVKEGMLGERVRVAATEGLNEIQPTLAGAPDGSLWIAWTRFAGSDYEVMARQYDPASGALGQEFNVSVDPQTDDIHPDVAVDGENRVWIAYDAVRDSARGASLQKGNDRGKSNVQQLLRCLDAGSLLAPLRYPDRPPMPGLASLAGGYPQIALGSGGAVQMAFRFFDVPNLPSRPYWFPVALWSYSGEEIPLGKVIENSDGRVEAVAIQATVSGTWVASQRFARPGVRPRGFSSTSEASIGYLTKPPVGSGIAVAFQPGSPAAPAPELVAAPVGASSTHDVVPARTRQVVEYGDRRLQVYWGDLHRHSVVSTCSTGFEPGPQDRYDFGRDVFDYDFYALTDHSDHCTSLDAWWLAKLVRAYHSDVFCTLQGFEWSSRGLGHYNVIFRGLPDLLMSPQHNETNNLTRLWSKLESGSAITIPHHSSHSRYPNDWSHYDPEFMKAVEVYQARRGNFEYDGCFRQADKAVTAGSFVQDALQRGLRMGIIASTDHGSGASYAAVLAESLDRGSVFDALRQRRVYGSTTRGILMDFRANGQLMGSEIRADGPLELSVEIEGTDELAEMVLFKNGAAFKAIGRQRVASEDAITKLQIFLRVHAKDPGAMVPVEIELDRGEIRQSRVRNQPEQTIQWSREGERRATILVPRLTVGLTSVIRLKNAEGAMLTLRLGQDEIVQAVSSLQANPVNEYNDRVECSITTIAGGETAELDLSRGLGSRSLRQSFTDGDLSDGWNWYYVRVIQKDGEMAWSSPIFVQH